VRVSPCENETISEGGENNIGVLNRKHRREFLIKPNLIVFNVFVVNMGPTTIKNTRKKNGKKNEKAVEFSRVKRGGKERN